MGLYRQENNNEITTNKENYYEITTNNTAKDNPTDKQRRMFTASTKQRRKFYNYEKSIFGVNYRRDFNDGGICSESGQQKYPDRQLDRCRNRRAWWAAAFQSSRELHRRRRLYRKRRRGQLRRRQPAIRRLGTSRRRKFPAVRGDILQLFYDANSNATLLGKVRQTVILDKSGNAWQGPGIVDLFAPDGSLIFSGTATATATRIQSEPLSAY